MNPFRALYWQKKVTVAIMLLSLLLQVQTVFACEMMDYNGPIEHCCCDEMESQKKESNDLDGTSDCCDIHGELFFKASDLQGDEPIILQANPAFELPQATLIFLLVSLWPDINHPKFSPDLWHLDADPGNPGTATYLSTLRLRI